MYGIFLEEGGGWGFKVVLKAWDASMQCFVSVSVFMFILAVRVCQVGYSIIADLLD